MSLLEAVTLKLPPQNVEAEQLVLGSILLDNAALLRSLEIVDESCFYRESHRKIFRAMVDLFERTEPIDLLTLKDRLQKLDALEQVGGATYLAHLLNLVPTAANVRHYARLVREKAILRQLISTATEIVEESYGESEDVEALLDRAEQRIFEIAERRLAENFVSLNQLLKESFRSLEQRVGRTESITGISTGFRELDKFTAGLQPSDLVIVAGRPSSGKTSLCLNFAQYAATNHSLPVAIFSLEMSAQQLALRMLCSEARIDSSRMRTGPLDASEWPQLTRAAGRLSEAPLFIDDSTGLSVLEIRAKARRLQKEHGLGLVVVDYLQLMSGRHTNENRQQEVAEITRSLKALAKELNVPVVAGSQLSRAVEQRPDRKPILADLRESGAIEQDGDLILMIHRPDMYPSTESEEEEEGRYAVTEQKRTRRRKPNAPEGTADILIAKQRNGPAGVSVRLTFLKQYARFVDFSSREAPF